ncbi:uncharacterized protein BJ171DRAFT_181373 [Polychytrium aggregatum]|uniref:uncharacterized protein n=1 Tax=Polychytrium aggregatum TaxID=110093 RepID=UPI0022FF341C|nr:uncharacterized protein BJ171DRAFT_181373 [Polychytrium aggregatum]KAI9202503.1 hypothetical protein BJ171DRAFT_181373 [Polychytrium aggregatum]
MKNLAQIALAFAGIALLGSAAADTAPESPANLALFSEGVEHFGSAALQAFASDRRLVARQQTTISGAALCASSGFCYVDVHTSHYCWDDFVSLTSNLPTTPLGLQQAFCTECWIKLIPYFTSVFSSNATLLQDVNTFKTTIGTVCGPNFLTTGQITTGSLSGTSVSSSDVVVVSPGGSVTTKPVPLSTSTVPVSTPISPGPSPSSSSGLSGGAIGGIVAGAVVVVALIAGFVIYSRKKPNDKPVDPNGSYNAASVPKPVYSAPAQVETSYPQQAAPPASQGYYPAQSAPPSQGYYPAQSAPPATQGYYPAQQQQPPAAQGYYPPQSAAPAPQGYYAGQQPPASQGYYAAPTSYPTDQKLSNPQFQPPQDAYAPAPAAAYQSTPSQYSQPQHSRFVVIQAYDTKSPYEMNLHLGDVIQLQSDFNTAGMAQVGFIVAQDSPQSSCAWRYGTLPQCSASVCSCTQPTVLRRLIRSLANAATNAVSCHR